MINPSPAYHIEQPLEPMNNGRTGEHMVSSNEFEELIAPHATTRTTGRWRFPADATLRIHFLQRSAD